MRRQWQLLILIFFLGNGVAEAHTILTTDDPGTKTRVTDFNCGQKVYVMALWNPLPLGHRTLRVIWKNPQGQTERTTNVPVSDEAAASWAWISFEGGSQAGIRDVFSADHGCEDLLGSWKADVFLDSAMIGTVNFTMSY